MFKISFLLIRIIYPKPRSNHLQYFKPHFISSPLTFQAPTRPITFHCIILSQSTPNVITEMSCLHNSKPVAHLIRQLLGEGWDHKCIKPQSTNQTKWRECIHSIVHDTIHIQTAEPTRRYWDRFEPRRQTTSFVSRFRQWNHF